MMAPFVYDSRRNSDHYEPEQKLENNNEKVPDDQNIMLEDYLR